jgi:hypothetical protein
MVRDRSWSTNSAIFKAGDVCTSWLAKTTYSGESFYVNGFSPRKVLH